MAEKRRPPATSAERLGRMLTIVPYLVRHPGTTLEDASALFSVPTSQLRQDLDLLFLSGLPPYGPGDLIDVEIDEDGRVWISMAEHFSRPLRLTRQEALAVRVRAVELMATPGVPQAPALASALEKLEASLGGAPGIVASEPPAAPAHLSAIREASEARARLRIGYVAASTGERTERTIDPEVVFASGGHWYVAAWDTEAGGERLLRVDRIDTLEATEESFTPRGLEGAGRSLYSPGVGDVEVHLTLSPRARWVAEYFATTTTDERPDGGLDVVLPTKQTTWVTRLLLRLGADASVASPGDLSEGVRDLARRTLAVYGR